MSVSWSCMWSERAQRYHLMATISLGGEAEFHTHGDLSADCTREQFWAEIHSMETFLKRVFPFEVGNGQKEKNP